jgi:hypothetical protein
LISRLTFHDSRADAASTGKAQRMTAAAMMEFMAMVRRKFANERDRCVNMPGCQVVNPRVRTQSRQFLQ